ncbi:hypothetical protein BJX65DRAFT_309164 [Aspergillus insuetus]
MFLVNYLTQPKIAFPAKINYEFESHIPRLLDEAGVPNFMWGEPYLGSIGSSTAFFIRHNLSFGVPGHLIDKAGEALAKAPFSYASRAGTNVPHSTRESPTRMTTTSTRTRKSRLFWEFPDPALGPPPPKRPVLQLVGDPRIKTDNHNVRDSRQPKPAGLYPVKMPVPARYTEAMILLQLRDSRGHGSLGQWQAELLYLLDPTQIRDLSLDFQDLTTPFREYAVAQSTEDGGGPSCLLPSVHCAL